MEPQEQRTFFDDRGYLVIEDLLSPDETADYQREIQRLHRLAADMETRGDERSGHFQREPFAKDQNRDGLPVLRKIENTRTLSEHFGHIAQDQDAPLSHRDDIDLRDSIDVALKAGSAVLFHSLMVHGSGPNQTDRSRNTALYAYFSPHVRYVPRAGGPREKAFPVIAGLDGAQEHTLVAS